MDQPGKFDIQITKNLLADRLINVLSGVSIRANTWWPLNYQRTAGTTGGVFPYDLTADVFGNIFQQFEPGSGSDLGGADAPGSGGINDLGAGTSPLFIATQIQIMQGFGSGGFGEGGFGGYTSAVG